MLTISKGRPRFTDPAELRTKDAHWARADVACHYGEPCLTVEYVRMMGSGGKVEPVVVRDSVPFRDVVLLRRYER